MRQLWQDRRDILLDPTGVLWGEIPLGNRPWPFAVQAMLLPSALVAAAVAIAFAFVDLPPTPVERIISMETARIERGAAKLSEYDLLSNGARRTDLMKLSLEDLVAREQALTAELTALRDREPARVPRGDMLSKIHARRAVINEINLRHYIRLGQKLHEARLKLGLWKLFRRVQMLLTNGLFILTGVTVFLNATLFRWLMMKGSAPFDHTWLADSAYLYFMGAALLWPNFSANVLNVAFDLASRYFIDEPFMLTLVKVFVALMVGIFLYVIIRIILLIRPLALAFRPHAGITRRRAFWEVAIRLYGAQFIAGLLVEIAVIGVILALALGMDFANRYG